MYTFRPVTMYTRKMDVTITEFRRNLFTLVEQAMDGVEVHVTHKGKGFTLKPDGPVPDKLSRLTPMDIIIGDLETASAELMEEMEAEWEKDWADL